MPAESPTKSESMEMREKRAVGFMLKIPPENIVKIYLLILLCLNIRLPERAQV